MPPVADVRDGAAFGLAVVAGRRGPQGFILVYSIVSEDTFKELQGVRDRILSVKESEEIPPMVLVGNKCDLEEVRGGAVRRAAGRWAAGGDLIEPVTILHRRSATRWVQERVVQKAQGQALAKKFNNCAFLETSAKMRINVDETFMTLVRQINKANPNFKEKQKRRCAIL